MNKLSPHRYLGDITNATAIMAEQSWCDVFYHWLRPGSTINSKRIENEFSIQTLFHLLSESWNRGINTADNFLNCLYLGYVIHWRCTSTTIKASLQELYPANTIVQFSNQNVKSNALCLTMIVISFYMQVMYLCEEYYKRNTLILAAFWIRPGFSDNLHWLLGLSTVLSRNNVCRSKLQKGNMIM